MWIWVSTTYYTVGIDVNENGVITAAPPIVRWAIGRTVEEYFLYIRKRGILIDWKEFDK